METIYARPHDYDLEHEGDLDDVAFFCRLTESLRPRRVLELACGSGRVTLPLAALGARAGFDVVALERAEPMIAEAERKRAAADPQVAARLTLVRGDLRTWRASSPFDLIVTPCSSVTHLLSIDEQLAAWNCAWSNLAPGGRFVVDVAMPNLGAFAESLQVPPRTLLEVDCDTRDAATGERMLRYKTTRYEPHRQRASIRFLYDKFPEQDAVDRYVSDFDCHVYFPRELELLFLISGFAVEAIYGDYHGSPLRATSRQMIAVGRRIERRGVYLESHATRAGRGDDRT